MDSPKLILRRFLNRVLRRALRARSRPYRLDGAPVTLVISPHQDDAHLGCGGLLARRRLLGCPVHLLHITDGSASHPGHPILAPASVAALRRAEARAAARVTGIEQEFVFFLDSPDGMLDRLESAAAESLAGRIAGAMRETRPDEVFLPCRRDLSSEHEATFQIFQRALKISGLHPRVLEYPIWSCWNQAALFRLLLSSCRVSRLAFFGYEGIKHRALAEYRSQFEPVPPWTAPVLPHGFLSFFLPAEEFFFEAAPSPDP